MNCRWAAVSAGMGPRSVPQDAMRGHARDESATVTPTLQGPRLTIPLFAAQTATVAPQPRAPAFRLSSERVKQQVSELVCGIGIS